MYRRGRIYKEPHKNTIIENTNTYPIQHTSCLTICHLMLTFGPQIILVITTCVVKIK
jgi:hypothetical protein